VSPDDIGAMWADGRARITVTDQSPVKIRDLVKCFLRAVERARAEVAGSKFRPPVIGGETRALGAVAEALNWVHTIDDYLGERGPEGETGTDRDSDWAAAFGQEQQDLVRGFRCARNRVHHEWWRAMSFRMSMASETEWIWAELPPSKQRPAPRGEAAYASAVEGRSVLEVLDALAAVIWKKRRWEIEVEDIEQPGHKVGSPIRFDHEAEAEHLERLATYGREDGVPPDSPGAAD
jgi:hypothetical protein